MTVSASEPLAGSVLMSDCPRAVFSPASIWILAELSALSTRPWAICSVRKKPSTAITAAEITSVVPTTRSCSDRCQRYLTLATIRCWTRSSDRIRIVSRCGSQLTIQRTHFRRRSAISHASRTSRCSRCSRRLLCSPGESAAGSSGEAASSDSGVDSGAGGGSGTTASGAGGRPTAAELAADHSIRRSARSRLVSDTAHRDHDLRVLGVLLDLGPQTLHVHVHQPRVGRVAVAPDLLEQHLTGEHLARLAGEGD